MPDTLSIADVLDRAADLIEPEGAWTKNVYARNADGQDTGLTQYRGPAVCWCVLGATSAVCRNERLVGEADEFLHAFVGCGLDAWNDAPERSQSEVVAKLREAAAKARGGQS